MSENTDSAQNESPTTPSDEGKATTATTTEAAASTATATVESTEASTATGENTEATEASEGAEGADAAEGAEAAEGSENADGSKSPDGEKRRKRDRKRGKKNGDGASAEGAAAPAQDVRKFKAGDALRARIVEIGESSATVDLWGKEQGTIDLKELLELGEKEGAPKAVGDSIDVTVIHDGMRGGSVVVSCDPDRVQKGRAKVKEAFESGAVIEGLVTGMNKGGLEVDVFGVRGFCPSSQIDVRFPPTVSPKSLVGQKIEFKVTSIVDDGKEAIVSRRALMEASVRARAEELKSQIKPGDLVKGTVISVKEYGVFLDLNGIEGLIHLTEMSHNRSARPSDLFKVGDEVEAKVLKITAGDPVPAVGEKAEKSEKSEKSEKTDAPAEAAETPAATAEGAEAAPAEGANKNKDNNKKDRRDREKRRDPGPALPRVMLSRKAVEKDPWEDAHKQYPPGSVHTGKVARMQPFGAFIELSSGLDGLLHVSELGQGRRIENPEEILSMGQSVTVKVEKVDRGQRRIALSLLPDGMTKEQLATAVTVRVGMIGKAKVVGHEGPGLHAEIEGAFGKFAKGYVHEKDSAQPRGADLKKALPVGTIINVKVVEIERGRVKLSIKDAARDEERQAYKAYQREANKTTVGTSLADKLRGKLGDLVKR